MGTRSRLRIRRRRHADVFLWAHWDGCFDGVGRDICDQLRALLERHGADGLRERVEAMRVAYRAAEVADAAIPRDVHDGHSMQFNALAAAIEGGVCVPNDRCDDVEYEYVLDTCAGVLTGRGSDNTGDARALTFERLLAGDTFTDTADDDHDAAIARILDECRVRMASDAEFNEREAALRVEIARCVHDEGAHCLSGWTAEEWFGVLTH